MSNPWGAVQTEPTELLSDIMAQQLSDPTPSSEASVLSDEEFARSLHEQLNSEPTVPVVVPAADLDTSNDLLLAALLQEEMDNEGSEATHSLENHVNGSRKVKVSYSHHYHPQPDYDEVSEESELRHFNYPDEEVDPTATKHNAHINGVRNAHKISEKFHPGFQSGDLGDDVVIPNKVYNELQVHSHKNKNCYRITDKQDISTHEHVFDKKTRLILLKLLNRGILERVNGIVSTGKESVIVHADGGLMEGIEVPKECVLKVYKTSLNEYSRRHEYLDHDPRYSKHSEHAVKGGRKLIEMWALKELHNLNRMRRAGIMCPDTVLLRKQILVMSFIGSHGVPSPKLKDVRMSSDQLKSAYQQLLHGMVTMYQTCRLVHADLSEYNLLWHNGTLHFIDVSQAVLRTHPSALTYLYRDCKTMWHYFKSRHLPNLETPQQLFNKVSDLDVKYETEREFIEKIEHLQREEIHHFKHGVISSDYAFEASFTENQQQLQLSDDDEDDEDDDDDDEGEGELVDPVSK